MPVFVIAQPLAEAAARDAVIYDVAIARGVADFRPAVLRAEVRDIAQFKMTSGLCLMVAAERRSR